MVHYTKTDDDGRIEVTTPYKEYSDEEMFEFDFPEDFDFGKQDDYRIVDGELIEDARPIPVEQQISQLKNKLSETDYVAAKLMDYQVMSRLLSNDEAERYSEIMVQRQEWRDQISALETQLETEESV